MTDDARAPIVAGEDALAQGDVTAARAHFARATSGSPTNASAWLGLAIACRDMNEDQAAVAAVDRCLMLSPRNFRALVVKGDLCHRAQDSRAAASFYTTALRCAPPPNQMAPALLDDFTRAREACDRYARQYEDFLLAQLAAKGLDAEKSSARFLQSFELSMGRKKLYFQQPSQYYFPELPQIQFYDRSLFPWMDEVEHATDAIAAELQAIMSEARAFQPYVERVANRPRPDNDTMTGNLDWAAFYLWKNGEMVAENAARFPRTLRALENVPQCRIAGRTPSILFSRLRPGAKIPPHHGYINTRLICHLPIIVPEKCGFRVGNDVRAWEKGKAWAFDDTIEHEAWNDSSETRVILIFEIWRPELNEEERTLVATMLEAIDAYRGKQIEWTD
jgi:aspartyl/asparaginyl beta-hydroxylase (cupin superfamily)